MLTPEQKADAEKRLKQMELDKQAQKKIKEIVKINSKKINDLIFSLKDDPKAQRLLLNSLSSKIGSMSLSFEKLTRGFETAEQKMKSERDQMNKQKLLNIEEKERVQLSIEQIKDTIKRIQQAVAGSVKEEADKRFKISDDLEKSLGQIKQKIVTFEKQSVQLEAENEVLRAKKKEITEKMSGLELNFKQKAEQKDDEVRKQKQQLMLRLQKLETQVSEVTEINKQLSSIQKSNFDKKLSLYLKEKKFHEYSTSFENSAKTIDQCKEEIFKGVQRMNDAKETIDKSQKQAKQLGNTFLLELKKKTEKQTKIDSVKKQKEAVRERIINLQNKLKEQKNKSQVA